MTVGRFRGEEVKSVGREKSLSERLRRKIELSSILRWTVARSEGEGREGRGGVGKMERGGV